MIIQGIKIHNVRGKNFDLELDRMNLIVGPNKSGKTTIADSLRFALLGYIPGMPKPPREWGELLGYGISNHARADVTIKTEIGEFKRSIITQVGGSIKVDPTGPIDAADLDINTLPLDAAAYFDATGPAQAEILAACSATDIKWHDLVSPFLRQAYPYAKEPWHAWVNQAIETAKNGKRDQNSLKAMYEQTVRGLSSMRGATVPDSATVERLLNAAHEKMGSKKHNLELLEKQVSAAKKPSKVSEAQKQLDRVESQLVSQKRTDVFGTFPERWKSNELVIATLEGKKGYLDAEAYAKLSREWSKVNTQRVAALEKLRELGGKMEDVKREYEHLRTAGKCPTCGHVGTGFKVNVNQLEFDECKDIEAQISVKKNEAKKFVADCKRLDLQVMKAREINALITQALKEKRDLNNEAAVITLWEKRDLLVEQVKSEKGPETNLEEVEQAKYDLECEIDEVQGEIRAYADEMKNISHTRSQKRQLAETEDLLVKSEKAVSQLAQDIKELDQLRQRFTTMSLAPILEKVQMFTAGIFENDLQLDGSEIGRFVGSKWVSLRQFSGSEQAVATAALTAALCVDGKANYLVMDELGRFDDEHLSAFLNNVRTAIGNGVITQFFGMSTPRKFIAPARMVDPEVKVIIL